MSRTTTFAAPGPGPETGAPAGGDRLLTRHEVRTLALASLGGVLEFFDFVIFVFFTATIGQLFFPADLPDWLRQLQTFGLFAAGYLARPLGGIVFAHFGDTRGRKRVFTFSVLLMAVPTLLIGLLPTYAEIGALAPLLLLVMRVLQGAAIGGEAPGGWVFVAEHVPPHRTGLAVGLLTGGLTGGILLGSLMATVLNLAFTPAQILGGWWRLPFLIGGVFGFAAMALRSWLRETPVFIEMRSQAAVARGLPVRTVLQAHRRAVWASVGSTWMLTAAIVVVILMTPTLLQKFFATSARDALLANLAGSVALCVSTVAVGAAIDRFGLRRTAVPACLLLAGSAYALYLGAASHPAALLPLYLLAGIGVGAVSVTPALMVRAFPAAVRFSGISMSYNLAYAVFGGATPVLLSWLSGIDRLAPAHYVAVAALVGLLAAWFAPRAADGKTT